MKKLSVPNKLVIKKYNRIGRIGFLLQIKLFADQKDKYLELKGNERKEAASEIKKTLH